MIRHGEVVPLKHGNIVTRLAAASRALGHVERCWKIPLHLEHIRDRLSGRGKHRLDVQIPCAGGIAALLTQTRATREGGVEKAGVKFGGLLVELIRRFLVFGPLK